MRIEPLPYDPRLAFSLPAWVIENIQPWQFGHGETKATCLWLKGLPPLQHTQVVEGRENRIHRMPPSADRWRERSRTFQGVADAMADQWGSLTNE